MMTSSKDSYFIYIAKYPTNKRFLSDIEEVFHGNFFKRSQNEIHIRKTFQTEILKFRKLSNKL